VPVESAGGVLDLAHLVHVDERGQGAQVDAGEGAPHGEALTFQAGGCGGHRAHGAVDGRGVDGGDAWQGHGVGADGWHARSLGDRGSASPCKDTCIRNIPVSGSLYASHLLETAEVSLQLPAELQPPRVDEPALPDWYTALREDWQARETAQ
jgi:hypothetical protein